MTYRFPLLESHRETGWLILIWNWFFMRWKLLNSLFASDPLCFTLSFNVAASRSDM
ncbi:hypothetical protein D3C73_1035280 [compost metagenome]